MASLLGFVTRNWKLKLAALGLAVLLWITVTADQLAVQWMMVPVEVELRDPNHRMVQGPRPAEVQVRISGPRREFWDLGMNRPQLRLVLTDVQEGSHQFPLDPQQVQIPRRVARGLTPIDVSPSRVTLTFEQIATAAVPVQVEVGSQPNEEYALVDTLQVQPATVTVTGAGRLVTAVAAVRTEPVDLATEAGPFERRVAIDTAGLAGLEVTPLEVLVVGRVERAVQQVLPDVPVQAPPGVLVVPGAVDVRVWGAESVLRTISADALRVVVPPESIPADVTAGGATAPLRVDRLPAGVRATPEPRYVRVLAAPSPPDPGLQPGPALPVPGPAAPPAPPGEPGEPPASPPDTLPPDATPGSR